MTEAKTKDNSQPVFPLLPLRDVVVFPHMVIPLFVGRTESIKALEAAMEKSKQIFLVSQKDPNVDSPQKKDLYEIGTIATILQLLRLPDGTVKVLVEGTQRGKIRKTSKQNEYFICEVDVFAEGSADPKEPEVQAIMRALLNQFERLIKINKKLPPELLTTLANIEDPGRLADSIAAHMTIKLDHRQKILEMADVRERLEALQGLLMQELELVEVEKRVQGRVKQQVEKS